MYLSHRQELERIRTESHSLVLGARKSCEDSSTNLAKSRASLERSLRLLGTRFYQLGD